MQPVVGRDHRSWSLVNGVDDLGVVNAPQVHGRDCQIGVPKLALDHQQRDPLARHLHGVCMAELVRREPSSHPSTRGNLMQLGADPGRSPRSSARWTPQDAEQRADWKLGAQREPRRELLPAPPVHPNLAALAALAMAD